MQVNQGNLFELGQVGPSSSSVCYAEKTCKVAGYEGKRGQRSTAGHHHFHGTFQTKILILQKIKLTGHTKMIAGIPILSYLWLSNKAPVIK